MLKLRLQGYNIFQSGRAIQNHDEKLKIKTNKKLLLIKTN